MQDVSINPQTLNQTLNPEPCIFPYSQQTLSPQKVEALTTAVCEDPSFRVRAAAAAPSRQVGDT